MAPNVSDLTSTPTEDEILDGFLALLMLAGFPVTSWQPGGIARTTARLLAKGLTKVGGLAADVTRGGFNSTADGDWLTLLSSEQYDNARLAATFAQGSVQLALTSALAGPYTLTPGQLWFTWQGRRYRSTSGGVLTYPSTLLVAFSAESPGSKYNAPDSTLTLLTPLAGLVVQASSITTQGTDAESDEALRARNRGKWSTVGAAANAAGYATWAREASPLVTRVKVQPNFPTPGDVRVIVAGPAGALAAPAVAAVTSYLAQRAPLTVMVTATNATVQTVSVVGNVRILASHPSSGSAFAAVTDALLALFAATPIGGTVRLSDLYAAIDAVPGVDSSLLSAPALDVTLGATVVAVPNLLLTPVYI